MVFFFVHYTAAAASNLFHTHTFVGFVVGTFSVSVFIFVPYEKKTQQLNLFVRTSKAKLPRNGQTTDIGKFVNGIQLVECCCCCRSYSTIAYHFTRIRYRANIVCIIE